MECVRVVAIGPELPRGGHKTAAPEHVGRMLIGARKPLVAANARQHDPRTVAGHTSSQLVVAQAEGPWNRVFEAKGIVQVMMQVSALERHGYERNAQCRATLPACCASSAFGYPRSE